MTLPETNNAERLQAIEARVNGRSFGDEPDGFALLNDARWLLAQNTELREADQVKKTLYFAGLWNDAIAERDAARAENTELRDALATLLDAWFAGPNADEWATAIAAARAVLDKWKD